MLWKPEQEINLAMSKCLMFIYFVHISFYLINIDFNARCFSLICRLLFAGFNFRIPFSCVQVHVPDISNSSSPLSLTCEEFDEVCTK